jgi:superfamily II DNA or RNA helicase
MSISVELGENCYILTGNIDFIKNKRRAKSNFEACGACFDEGDKIVIPFSTEEIPSDFGDEEKQYRVILKLFNKFDIKFEKTEQVKDFVSEIDQENKNFKKFSLKAKNIRNNIHADNDFKNFTNIVSKELNRELYPLQLLSSYHLAFSQNACNFSVPGAGKTSIVYGAYAYLKSLPFNHPKHIDRLLIISPLAAFAPWKNEYKECFNRNTTIKELVGVSPSQRKNHFYSDEYTEITLISYQSASNESDVQGIKDFLKRNKVMLVLDEAHRIKNTEGGKWAEAVLSIAKYANSRVILTGTPAPNGYQDLYNLYKFIWPSKNVIGYPVNYLQELGASYTPSAKQDIKTLVDRISPFFIRVKKSDLGLPEPIENRPIMVQMSKTQREIYDYIEQKYIDSFETENNNSSFVNKLKKAKLIRLMQCVTNPNLLNRVLENYLVEEGLTNNLDVDDRGIMQLIKSYNPKQEMPPKFIKILELLQQINAKQGADGKVVIWSIFVQNIHDLKEYLNINGIECELLYGAIPVDKIEIDMPNREEIIGQFHRSDCPYKVIIANPFAVGESISLHKACHNAIYLEKSFNAAMYMQSKDRIHRYGLNNDNIINYYYLISKDSIDQTIHDRVLEKEQRMLDIIENEEIPLLNMNMEDSDENNEGDIKAIIRDYHARKTTATQ